MKYYLIGIKGSGMSALAQMLYDKGNEVVGSDLDTYFFTQDKLSHMKIYPLGTILEGYIYIVGNAYVGLSDHLEVLERGYECYKYNEFLGSLEGVSIAISGTHGKTTTTSLISKIFSKERCDVIIGDGNGIGHPNNNYIIYEACEYKRHFLAYSPHFLVINNIEYEHTDYYKDIDDVINSFQSLVDQSNTVLANGDDLNCRKLKGNNIIYFGFNEENNYVIKLIDENYPYRIQISNKNISYYYTVPFYGKHMIYNTAAAVITAIIHNVSDVQNAIDNFVFPNRRMKEYNINGYTIIDDYGHHPTEIDCTIDAIKDKYRKKIVLVFQPHTYTRTIDLEKDFIRVLKKADYLYIADVFSSVREKPRENRSLLVDKIPGAKHFSGSDDDILELKKYNDSVIVFMGAGNIYENISRFYENE